MVRFDGTNYVVPPAVMQEILKRLNKLAATNGVWHP
jgi:hypothetical protein